MTTDPVDQLADAVDTVAREVGDVRPDQWTQPTPCSEWNVSDLVAHLVNGHAPPQPVAEDAPPLDQLVACLGRDPDWSPPS